MASLPRGLVREEAEKADTSLPPYQRMDLGNALFWTLEVAAENIAQKGIAVRLDDGPGGHPPAACQASCRSAMPSRRTQTPSRQRPAA